MSCHIIPGISVFGLEDMAAALVILVGFPCGFPGHLVTHKESAGLRLLWPAACGWALRLANKKLEKQMNVCPLFVAVQLLLHQKHTELLDW